MLNISKVKKQTNSPEKTQLMWKQLLNSSQILVNNIPQFSDAKACHLRMTYSKLQSLKRINPQSKIQPVQKMRVSFLLQNQNRMTSRMNNDLEIKGDMKNGNIFKMTVRRYDANDNFSHSLGPMKTLDARETNKIEEGKQKNKKYDSIENNGGKKSQQFSDYFKKIIIDQRANYDLTKICSEGKCINMTDRTHFERLQRVKWSLLNRKIEEKQKSFRCVSTKLNSYKIEKSNMWLLPGLAKMRKDEEESKQKRLNKSKKSLKLKSNIKETIGGGSFNFEPWESTSIFNDEEDH